MRPRQQGLQVPVPRLVVRPRRAARRHAERRTRTSTSSASRLPAPRDRRRSRTRGFLFVNLSDAPEPLLPSLREGTESITNFDRYRIDELRIGVRIALRGRGQLEDRRRELQRVPPLPDGPSRARLGRAAVPLRRGLGRETRDDGNWMIEGATSLHPDRPLRPAAAARTSSPTTTACTTAPSSSRTCCSTCTPTARCTTCSARRARATRPSSRSTCSGPRRSPRPSFKPDPVVELWDLISQAGLGRSASGPRPASASRAYTTGVYPRQDRFLFDFNERYRREMGRPTIG